MRRSPSTTALRRARSRKESTTMANVNSDLETLHATLVQVHDILHQRLGQATDPRVAQALLTEMQEITHRIDLVQTLLFAQTTAAITSAIGDIQSATANLNASLASIQTATAIV